MVETLVKDKKNGNKADFEITGTDWDPEIDKIRETFADKLKAAVHLKHSGKGKGKVIISYKSMQDLERILGLIP
jgi:ParB family chromosome partitioning protein